MYASCLYCKHGRSSATPLLAATPRATPVRQTGTAGYLHGVACSARNAKHGQGLCSGKAMLRAPEGVLQTQTPSNPGICVVYNRSHKLRNICAHRQHRRTAVGGQLRRGGAGADVGRDHLALRGRAASALRS